MAEKFTRRSFQRSAAFAAAGFAAAPLTAASYSRVIGANDRIRLGFIGVGNRGTQLLHAFMQHKDAEVAALCDIYKPYLERDASKVDAELHKALGGFTPRMGERFGSEVARYSDFRRLLERKDIDAVVIATPDHWHAIQTIAACKAGKDVYCEKPLSITVVEGRKMVEAARRYKRVVQVGTQRRSSPVYQRMAKRALRGDFGKICIARAYRLSNMWPYGIGRERARKPPAGLDWDMWLGPRPERPYQPNIAPYRFRWWQLYSSQMANWGVHYLDAIRWFMGELAPQSVCAMGGRFAVDDDRTIPDTMETTFQFASGRIAIFGQYETSQTAMFPYGEIEYRGTRGTLYMSSRGYRVVPERGGQFQESKPRMKAEQYDEKASNASLTVLHTRNFLDCVRSRAKPNADIEIGHRSTTFSLIANISLSVKQRLEWDAERERFTNSEAANAMLHYEYRKPWSLDI